jgi:predicted nucleic acid-binding protein
MANLRLRPFVDTSAWLDALRIEAGPAAAVLEQHARGEVVIVVSRQVLEEVITVLRAIRPELLPCLQIYLTSSTPEVCPDPDISEVRRMIACIGHHHAPILAAAIQSRADCLVTTNPVHLAPEVARCARFPILAPSTRLAALSGPRPITATTERSS